MDTTGACENANGAANGGGGAEVVAPGAMGRASSGYRIACARSLFKERLHELARDRAGKWPQNCFAPGRYTLKHASADAVAAL